MSLDAVTDSLKQSLDLFKNNAVALVVGTIISMILVCLIVTAGPGIYGLAYMAVKAFRGEKVEIGDVFFAFRSVKRFIRGWMFAIVLFVLVFIIGIIAGILFGVLSQINEYLAVMAFFIAYILIFLVMIGLMYAQTIFVLDSSKGVIDAMKESLSISKENILVTIVAIIVVSILSFIGSLVFGILTLVTTPICNLFIVGLVKELRPDIPDTADDV